MRTNKSAFTLIELLVVIAIIAILAAILFPVFASAKTAAKKAKDLSNQKQAGMAQIMYCSDNDDRFAGSTAPVDSSGVPLGSPEWDLARWWGWDAPLGVDDVDGGKRAGYSPLQYAGVAVWTKGISPYLKNQEIMRSPIDVGGDNSYGWDWNGNPKCPGTNWQMNAELWGATQNQVPDVTNLTMYRSVNISHRIPNCNPTQIYVDGEKTYASWLYLNDGNDGSFGEGANVTWVDGHAKYKLARTYTWKQFGLTDWDGLVPPGTTWYWYGGVPWRGRPTF